MKRLLVAFEVSALLRGSLALGERVTEGEVLRRLHAVAEAG